MDKNNLGKIILKIFKTYYPKDKINLGESDISNILEKANIKKENVRKEELIQIIKIIKHHIDLGKYNTPEVKDTNYKPIFRDLNKDDSFLDKQRIEYFDNLKQLREDESKNINNNMDIMPQKMRIKEIMNEEYNEFEYFVIVDSKDRDLDLYTSPSDYVIPLGVSNIGKDEKTGYIVRNYENVISVELIQFMLKDTRGVTGASDNPKIPPYIYLEIEEFANTYEGTGNFISNTFARLIYYDLLDDGTDKYRVYTVDDMCKKLFKPRRNLNKLTIRIRTPSGDLYNFGNVSDSKTITMSSFTLKIVTYQKNLTTNFISKSN